MYSVQKAGNFQISAMDLTSLSSVDIKKRILMGRNLRISPKDQTVSRFAYNYFLSFFAFRFLKMEECALYGDPVVQRGKYYLLR